MTHFQGATGGVYKTQKQIHRSVLIYDYWRFLLQDLKLQRSIRTSNSFQVFALPHGMASHCTIHCNTCVAQLIKAIMTWQLVPTFILLKMIFQSGGSLGISLVIILKKRHKTRTDDSHATPVFTFEYSFSWNLKPWGFLWVPFIVNYHKNSLFSKSLYLGLGCS